MSQEKNTASNSDMEAAGKEIESLPQNQAEILCATGVGPWNTISTTALVKPV